MDQQNYIVPGLLLLGLFRLGLFDVDKLASDAEIVELYTFVSVLLRVEGDEAEATRGISMHVAQYDGILYPAKLFEKAFEFIYGLKIL